MYEKLFVIKEGKSGDRKTDQIYPLGPLMEAYETQEEKIRLDFCYS